EIPEAEATQAALAPRINRLGGGRICLGRKFRCGRQGENADERDESRIRGPRDYGQPNGSKPGAERVPGDGLEPYPRERGSAGAVRSAPCELARRFGIAGGCVLHLRRRSRGAA